MSKMHYFSNEFLKIAKRWELSAIPFPQRLLTFNIGDLKFRDLAKWWFFKADYAEIKLQNIVMTSSPLRHRKIWPK